MVVKGLAFTTSRAAQGLIRFDSSRGFETGKSRLLRPRFFIYGVLMTAMAVLFVLRSIDRENFQVTVLRSAGIPYTVDDGRIRNNFAFALQNKSSERRVYFIAPAADALAGHENVEYIVPQDRIELDPLTDRQIDLF